jgi:hypothetical protein
LPRLEIVHSHRSVCPPRHAVVRPHKTKLSLGSPPILDPPIPTRNPKPETRVPKPESRNPKPESRNPKPETRVPKPESRNPNPESLQHTSRAKPTPVNDLQFKVFLLGLRVLDLNGGEGPYPNVSTCPVVDRHADSRQHPTPRVPTPDTPRISRALFISTGLSHWSL